MGDLLNWLAESQDNREQFVCALIKDGVAIQLRAMLQERGWTQAQLAEKAGVAPATVSDILNDGALTATLRTLQKLAAAFDVALIVRFCSFEELIEWARQLGKLAPREFPSRNCWEYTRS